MATATLAETLSFCAKNQVLLEITYNGTVRTVEPYSYRTSKKGNQLLYAFDVGEGHTKSFSVGNIEHVKATNVKFQPRFPIEIT